MSKDCEFKHQPVLATEVIQNLAIREGSFYVDCTLGGGGHSSLILRHLSHGILLALDRDEFAIHAGSAKIQEVASNNQLILEQTEFGNLKSVIEEKGLPLIDGVLVDLGVSSAQLDQAQRGFSFRFDGPLDMRMNPLQELSARDVVNSYSEAQLADIFFRYGEERYSARIARGIIQARSKQEITTTYQLVNLIEKMMPSKSRREKHPAKRCFQALRIEVNRELEQLEQLLSDLPLLVNHSARLCIITFHSLEDRIVKHCFKRWESPCVCPKNLPCTCQKKSLGKIINHKGITASRTELEQNRRSHSARLRIFEFV